MKREYNISEEYRDNFNKYLRKTMDDEYDNHIKHAIKAIKEKEIKDVVEAVELIDHLYKFKVKHRKWEFNLYNYLKIAKFPLHDELKLKSKRKEFANILINEIWHKVCPKKSKKT